jgi:hypothetical protein
MPLKAPRILETTTPGEAIDGARAITTIQVVVEVMDGIRAIIITTTLVEVDGVVIQVAVAAAEETIRGIMAVGSQRDLMDGEGASFERSAFAYGRFARGDICGEVYEREEQKVHLREWLL